GPANCGSGRSVGLGRSGDGMATVLSKGLPDPASRLCRELGKPCHTAAAIVKPALGTTLPAQLFPLPSPAESHRGRAIPINLAEVAEARLPRGGADMEKRGDSAGGLAHRRAGKRLRRPLYPTVTSGTATPISYDLFPIYAMLSGAAS